MTIEVTEVTSLAQVPRTVVRVSQERTHFPTQWLLEDEVMQRNAFLGDRLNASPSLQSQAYPSIQRSLDS